MKTSFAVAPRGAVAVLLTVAACSPAGGLDLGPDHPHLHYAGIWRPEAHGMAVNWQGSAVSLRFMGTGIAAKLGSAVDGDQWRVVTDGMPAPERLVLRRGTHRYVLATGLEPGRAHDVTLFKETFSGQASHLFGLEIHGAAPDTLASPGAYSLRIAFYGDSNMDGTSLYSEKNAEEGGTYFAFPAMASRMLAAEMQLQARGGATLAGKENTNNVLFFIRSADGTTWDKDFRTGFDPDVVVVNAGANDIFQVDEAHRKELVKARYHQVIRELRAAYGERAHIVLMNAYGWDLNEPANYSHEVVAEAGGRLSVLLFPWLWEQWHGCEWDHSGQAHMLAEHIASLDERWAIRRPGDIVNSFNRSGNVTNGGFEYQTPMGSFGWRYMDDGVDRIHDPDGAPEGNYYVHLEPGERVHQPTDATGDLRPGATLGGESYVVSAMIRADSGQARATIATHFQGQQIYTHDDDPSTFQSSVFDLTGEWRRYVHVATARPGVWTAYHFLEALEGAVEFDDVRVEFRPAGTQP